MKKFKRWWKQVKEYFRIFGGLLLFIVGVKALFNLMGSFKKDPDIEKKKKEVKDLKNKAGTDKVKAEDFKNKARAGDKKRKKIRDKHSTIVHIVTFFLLLPSLFFGEYIVYDEEDNVNRDYGNITNYVRSLSEEKIEWLATRGHLYNSLTFYSNAYTNMSKASGIQGKIIKKQEPSWCERAWDKTKFYVGGVLGAAVTLVIVALSG